jgi:hypothetical protein
MLTAAIRRKTILLLLAAVLAAPWASAAAPRAEDSRPVQAVAPAPPELLGRIWSFLQSVWSKTGCSIDPFGRCDADPGQQSVQAKSNCSIDPDGRCVP